MLMTSLGLSIAVFGETTAGANEEVVRVLSSTSGFDNAHLHLPAEGTALNSSSVVVEGMLVGFEGDYVPLGHGTNELRLSDHKGSDGDSFFLTLEIGEVNISVSKKNSEAAVGGCPPGLIRKLDRCVERVSTSK
jgi:hypothetical protein